MCRMRLKKEGWIVDDPETMDEVPMTGEDVIRGMFEAEGSKKKVSERLLEIGIPGLRYLDGTSRKRVKAPTTTSSGIRKSSTASRCWSATARSLTPSGRQKRLATASTAANPSTAARSPQRR